MKKILFSLSFCIAAVYSVNAQNCTPDPQYTTASPTGVYPKPDSLPGSAQGCHSPLPCAIVGQPYSFTFTAVVPATVPYQGNNVALNKVVILSVDNRPPGINYVCQSNNAANSTSCTFPKSTIGCVKMTGTPTAAGVYPMVVNTNVCILFGSPCLAQSFPSKSGDPITITGDYTLAVLPNAQAVCPSSDASCYVSTRNEKGTLTVASSPNPTNGPINIYVGSQKEIDGAEFIVTDAYGKRVATERVYLSAGQSNIVFFDGSTLPQGVYYYSISNGTDVLSNKFVIAR